MAHIRNNCLKENTLQVEINQQCQDIANISGGNDCCDELIDGLDNVTNQITEVDGKIDSLSTQSKECCKLLLDRLNRIDAKIPFRPVPTPKPIIVKEYIEVRTTVYVPVKEKKPNKVEILPPSSIPPSSIPGWIWDDVNKYFYKIKRNIKYIRINSQVWREDEYIKYRKSVPIRIGWHFGKVI